MSTPHPFAGHDNRNSIDHDGTRRVNLPDVSGDETRVYLVVDGKLLGGRPRHERHVLLQVYRAGSDPLQRASVLLTREQLLDALGACDAPF